MKFEFDKLIPNWIKKDDFVRSAVDLFGKNPHLSHVQQPFFDKVKGVLVGRLVVDRRDCFVRWIKNNTRRVA